MIKIGITSDVDKKNAESLFKALSIAYNMIEKNRRDNNISEYAECIYAKEALKQYESKHNAAQNPGYGRQNNSYGSGYRNTYRQDMYRNRNSRYNRTNNIDKDTLAFYAGTIRRIVGKNKKQSYINCAGNVVYEYEFKHKSGIRYKIYSENTFEELSNSDVRIQVDCEMLSDSNIDKSQKYDVQDANSQFGYVGKIVSDKFHGYRLSKNTNII